MDATRYGPAALTSRLRRSKTDERVAVMLAAAVADELGAGILREHDAAAGRHLTDLIQTAADRAGTSAVNRLVLEVLELLDQEPDLRDRLDQLHPELGAEGPDPTVFRDRASVRPTSI